MFFIIIIPKSIMFILRKKKMPTATKAVSINLFYNSNSKHIKVNKLRITKWRIIVNFCITHSEINTTNNKFSIFIANGKSFHIIKIKCCPCRSRCKSSTSSRLLPTVVKSYICNRSRIFGNQCLLCITYDVLNSSTLF